METRDVFTLILLCLSAIGTLVGVSAFIFGRVSRTEFEIAIDKVNGTVNRLDAALHKKDRDSVEVHAGFVTRREFEAVMAKIEGKLEKRFDSIVCSVECIEKTLNVVSVSIAAFTGTTLHAKKE